MNGKSYAVIGLGRFGISLASTLAEADCDVMVVDIDEEKIQEMAEKVTYAVKADVKEPGTLKALGVQNMDVVVVGISENMEASILATLQAKDLKVPFVMAKAMNELHGRILSKVGADEVIYPEKTMGLRTARNLLSNGLLDIFELSQDFSIAEFSVPESWVGKSLSQLKIREKHNINVVAIKSADTVSVDLDPTVPLSAGCTLIAFGRNRDLNRVS